jgi:hypothetical protein
MMALDQRRSAPPLGANLDHSAGVPFGGVMPLSEAWFSVASRTLVIGV